MSTSSPERRRRRRRRRAVLWLVLLALAAAAIALVLLRRTGPPPPRVVLTAVERTTFTREVSGTGVVSPARERLLAFPTAGTVGSLPVAEGDRVQEGATLAALDTSALERDLASNRSALASARADLARVRAQQGVDLLDLQAGVTSAEDQVASAEQTLQDASDKRAVSERLVGAGAASRDELRAAQDAEDAARRRLTQARQALESARAKLTNVTGLAEAQIASGEANVARLETAVANQEQQIREATLRAPFAGVVSSVPFKVGDQVAPGSGRAVDLVDDSSLSVTADFDENRSLELAAGQDGTVTPDAAPDVALPARVRRVSPVADRSQGTAQVRAELDLVAAPDAGAPAGALRPGYTVTARVVVNRIADALVVPLESVAGEGAQTHVYLVRILEAGRGTVERVVVRVSDRNATLAAVTGDGLAAGDRVAVTGLDGLTEGQAVSFTPVAPAAP